jgi:hypothetical protein
MVTISRTMMCVTSVNAKEGLFTNKGRVPQ